MSFQLSAGVRVQVRENACQIAEFRKGLTFNKSMELYQGHAGTIRTIDPIDGTFTITFDDREMSQWRWTIDWVIILQIKIGPNVFTVGATVQVLPVIPEASMTNKKTACWSQAKHHLLGQIGTISAIDSNGDLTIAFPGLPTLSYWSTEWVLLVDVAAEKKRKWAAIEADLTSLHANANKIMKKIKS